MNPLFKRLLEKHTPKVNPYVMDGLACLYMQKTEAYIDAVFKSVNRSFPKGLEYVGFQRCTPQEEYEETTRPYNNKRMYNLARSDLYLVKYFFRYNGEDLPPRYISLPYVNDGGIIHLGGAMFHITPVLSDKVISPGLDNVFVRLLRDKVTFKRCSHSYVIGGLRETVQVVWSMIYRKNKDGKKVPITTKANTCMVHYLLAKYGFSEMFQKYCGFVPVVGEDEINADSYPDSDWVICQSDRIKPKTYIQTHYEASRIRLAIPVHKWDSFVKSMVGGFFYTVDHFPNEIKPKEMDNTAVWMILLGHITFSGVYGYNTLYSKIDEHFASLNEYVDTIKVEELAEAGYRVENFYDLLALVIRHFNDWVVTSGQHAVSVYGKTLEVLYYVLFDITSGIFKANFMLNKQATKKVLTPKDITETFNKRLRTGAIHSLRSGKIVAANVSYSGDHKYPKITSILSEQETLPDGTRGRKNRKSITERDRIHTSMLEAGCMLFLPKSNPSPMARINPFIRFNLNNGVVESNPEFREVLERTDRTLKGHINPAASLFIDEGTDEDITDVED